jgi:regulator of replication initiation timing
MFLKEFTILKKLYYDRCLDFKFEINKDEYMTENLLQKLEEKMMILLTEVEDLREQTQRLNHENTSLKIERESHAKKLQDLISLLDAVNPVESLTENTTLSIVKTNLGSRE